MLKEILVLKNYVFRGFVLNGSGKVFSLADWRVDLDDYFDPSSRALDYFHVISIDFDNVVSGMFDIKVYSVTGLEQALHLLGLFCDTNDLDICISSDYICKSNDATYHRKLRRKLSSV